MKTLDRAQIRDEARLPFRQHARPSDADVAEALAALSKMEGVLAVIDREDRLDYQRRAGYRTFERAAALPAPALAKHDEPVMPPLVEEWHPKLNVLDSFPGLPQVHIASQIPDKIKSKYLKYLQWGDTKYIEKTLERISLGQPELTAADIHDIPSDTPEAKAVRKEFTYHAEGGRFYTFYRFDTSEPPQTLQLIHKFHGKDLTIEFHGMSIYRDGRDLEPGYYVLSGSHIPMEFYTLSELKERKAKHHRDHPHHHSSLPQPRQPLPS